MPDKKNKPDIILASFPRSGNTFLRNVFMDVFGLYTSNNFKVYNKGLSERNKLERFRRFKSLSQKGERRLEELNKRYKYKIVKSHDLPGQVLHLCNKDTFVIYIIRDGRDSLVSMAHHRKDIVKPGTDYLLNLKEALRAPMGSYFGGWGRNVEEWSKKADLILYFEELVNKPEKAILKLREALNLPEPDMGKIPTFESQRKGGSHFGGRKRKKLSIEEQDDFNEKFFRSGKQGGWKDEMPEDIQEKFWKKYGKTMTDHAYLQEGGRE